MCIVPSLLLSREEPLHFQVLVFVLGREVALDPTIAKDRHLPRHRRRFSAPKIASSTQHAKKKDVSTTIDSYTSIPPSNAQLPTLTLKKERKMETSELG
jgi:hypothetical protein